MLSAFIVNQATEVVACHEIAIGEETGIAVARELKMARIERSVPILHLW